MKKLVKRVLPLVLAAVLVIGSCLTVHAEEPAIDYQHLTREDMYSLIKECGKIVNSKIYPVYKYQMFSYYANGDGTYHSFKFYVSEQPFGAAGSENWPNVSIRNLSDKSSRYYEFSVDGAGKIVYSDVLTVDPNGTKSMIEYRNAHVQSNYNLIPKGSDGSAYVAIPSDSYDFFLVPPTPPVVATAVGAVDLTAVLKEIISLTPLLILFLVGLEAFWKGLRFLSSILHQA